MIKNRKGFTIIELLVVIAIIGLLASVILVGLNGARKSGRDARRIADMKQVQVGLESYFAKNGSYPIGATWAGMVTALTGPNGIAGFNNVPNDPNSPTASYGYASDGNTYVVYASLEDQNNQVLKSDVDADFSTLGGPNCAPAGGVDLYCVSL